MSPLFALLHYLAAFTLVAALAIEVALANGDLTARRARTIMVADLSWRNAVKQDRRRAWMRGNFPSSGRSSTWSSQTSL